MRFDARHVGSGVWGVWDAGVMSWRATDLRENEAQQHAADMNVVYNQTFMSGRRRAHVPHEDPAVLQVQAENRRARQARPIALAAPVVIIGEEFRCYDDDVTVAERSSRSAAGHTSNLDRDTYGSRRSASPRFVAGRSALDWRASCSHRVSDIAAATGSR